MQRISDQGKLAVRNVSNSYSVCSMASFGGIVMITQLTRMVTMTRKLNSGWTSMYMATRRIGLNGSSMYIEGVALNLKISCPLLTTTNV